jgi:1,4-dihydroxy-2-naphthoyl-CoA synthase
MLMRRWSQGAAREASKLEMDYLMTMKHGQEASEAVSAFILKRTPDFSQFT